ncbi:pirin family protein [Roseibium sp. M-1]
MMQQTDPCSIADIFPTRNIVGRTRGNGHNGITRLVSPSDLGETLKPFVFLDHFDLNRNAFPGMDMHPHSGIATVTYLFEGNVRYEDTNGQSGLLEQGSVEWFSAGGGAWHGGGAGDSEKARGFQLWIALPGDKELADPFSLYRDETEIETIGPASVIIGTYGNATSPWVSPSPINYLAVRLKANEIWTYQPPEGHTVGWAAVSIGSLRTPAPIGAGEFVVFEPGGGAITFLACEPTDLVIGSAAPHPYDLVLGRFSVHTHPLALSAAEERIYRIQQDLQKEGRL